MGEGSIHFLMKINQDGVFCQVAEATEDVKTQQLSNKNNHLVRPS